MNARVSCRAKPHGKLLVYRRGRESCRNCRESRQLSPMMMLSLEKSEHPSRAGEAGTPEAPQRWGDPCDGRGAPPARGARGRCSPHWAPSSQGVTIAIGQPLTLVRPRWQGQGCGAPRRPRLQRQVGLAVTSGSRSPFPAALPEVWPLLVFSHLPLPGQSVTWLTCAVGAEGCVRTWGGEARDTESSGDRGRGPVLGRSLL